MPIAQNGLGGWGGLGLTGYSGLHDWTYRLQQFTRLEAVPAQSHDRPERPKKGGSEHLKNIRRVKTTGERATRAGPRPLARPVHPLIRLITRKNCGEGVSVREKSAAAHSWRGQVRRRRVRTSSDLGGPRGAGAAPWSHRVVREERKSYKLQHGSRAGVSCTLRLRPVAVAAGRGAAAKNPSELQPVTR